MESGLNYRLTKMFEAVYSGKVHSRYSGWKMVLIKKKNSMVIINYSGTWRTNRHWGETDFRGNPDFMAPDGYRGPGHPEGCMLLRIGNSNIYSHNNLPVVIGKDEEGEIFLACNDAPTDEALKDNKKYISYTLSYID